MLSGTVLASGAYNIPVLRIPNLVIGPSWLSSHPGISCVEKSCVGERQVSDSSALPTAEIKLPCSRVRRGRYDQSCRLGERNEFGRDSG